VLFFCFFSTAFAYDWSTNPGNGSAGNPYQISTAEQLMSIGSDSVLLTKNFILTNDIDLAGHTFAQAVIAPDNDSVASGFQGQQFTGIFDGNNHTIYNLNIMAPTKDYIGLFGLVSVSYINYGAQIYNVGMIYNLGVENFNITGRNFVGGLVGENRSSIIACYTAGSIVGTGNNVGGFAGLNCSSITSCYANSSVTGSGNSVGGLVGHNSSSITTCYATGLVSGTLYVGGLVGIGDGGVSNCFWDIETSGLTVSSGGTGKSTIEMQTFATFTDAGWDFIGESTNGLHDYWQMEVHDYPRLTIPVWTLAGNGTSIYPYIIADAADLGKVWLRPAACYQLNSNLDLTGTSWSSVVVPSFTGSFNGQGFVISHLTINLPDSDYIGLFRRVYCNGQIKNLGVENVDIIGRNYVGGLVGENVGFYNGGYGTLISCYVTGSVIGTGYSYSVGGLVGRNSTDITTCYTNSSVSGNSSVGGLVGNNEGGSLSGCYATGSVTGTENSSSIGGLVGGNYMGWLASCYATGSVIGAEYSYSVGGLVGENRSSITSCYATGSVSGGNSVGGLLGSNSGDIRSCYAIGLVTGTAEWPAYVGGLVGAGSGELITCFWDIQISGQSVGVGSLGSPLGVSGKSTTEMKTLATFTDVGWDFVETWLMLEGNYPRLISLSNTLSIQTNPSFIASVSPIVGQYAVTGIVGISAARFSQCPDVYQFDHWEGGVDDPNSASTTVFVNGNKTITAVFTLAAPVCGDECHPNFTVGDLNHDCIVDLGDFAILASRWMNCTKPECD
jgi:hypothetical protein